MSNEQNSLIVEGVNPLNDSHYKITLLPSGKINQFTEWNSRASKSKWIVSAYADSFGSYVSNIRWGDCSFATTANSKFQLKRMSDTLEYLDWVLDDEPSTRPSWKPWDPSSVLPAPTATEPEPQAPGRTLKQDFQLFRARTKTLTLLQWDMERSAHEYELVEEDEATGHSTVIPMPPDAFNELFRVVKAIVKEEFESVGFPVEQAFADVLPQP